MYDEKARQVKAAKVLAVLEDYLGKMADKRLLDIGCSTGFMTALYAEKFASTLGIDLDPQAIENANSARSSPKLSFQIGDAMGTGLPPQSFDVITCTHIYEHVPSADRLLQEIKRLLKPGGVCFFSAGNRYIWREGHYDLPLLSAIPKWLAHPYIRLSGKAPFYYENHLSLWGLRKLVRAFQVVDYTLRVIEDPVRFHAADMIRPDGLAQKTLLQFEPLLYWLIPTYIWILVAPQD